jgi:hypothetical protein
MNWDNVISKKIGARFDPSMTCRIIFDQSNHPIHGANIILKSANRPLSERGHYENLESNLHENDQDMTDMGQTLGQ